MLQNALHYLLIVESKYPRRCWQGKNESWKFTPQSNFSAFKQLSQMTLIEGVNDTESTQFSLYTGWPKWRYEPYSASEKGEWDKCIFPLIFYLEFLFLMSKEYVPFTLKSNICVFILQWIKRWTNSRQNKQTQNWS